MNKEEIEDILEELHLVRPEILKPKAKKLFEAIMSIADERDELQQENQELKDNWNKLKEIIKEKFVAQGGFTSYEWNDLLNELLDKMQELQAINKQCEELGWNK